MFRAKISIYYQIKKEKPKKIGNKRKTVQVAGAGIADSVYLRCHHFFCFLHLFVVFG